MRMTHYYLAVALLLAPALLATLVTGIFHDGTDTHLLLGLFTSIGCVLSNTLFILFMIVSGRVLKAAMKARPLAPRFLDELNEFFARKKAYPMALVAATLAVATAVLGNGRYIGVPLAVHFVFGLVTVVFNLLVIPASLRTLRANQLLLDRVARELDRIDREAPPALAADTGEPEWRFGRRARWLIFAASAWMPYLYWALVVWRGRFERVPTPFLVLTAVACVAGVLVALIGRESRTAR